MALSFDTKEKKNLAILAGVLALVIVGLVVVFVVVPALSGGSEEPVLTAKSDDKAKAGAPNPAAESPPGTPAGGAPPAGATGGAAAATTTTTVVSVGAKRQSLPFGQPRPDPFLPHYIKMRPLPPDYSPPVMQRPPISIPQPATMTVATLPLPRTGAGPSMIPISSPPNFTSLQPVQIPQLVTTPSVPRFQPGSQQTGVVGRATRRRVSGILIGDSVRAILEIGEGNQKVTRIVQPGDEVDGIRVLRVERIREGANVTTRMIISEGGEERFVELTPSNEAPPVAPQGFGTIGGAQPPGGFGDAPGMGGNPFARG